MPLVKACLTPVICLSALVLLTQIQSVHARNFVGYTGKGWASDFGVLRGQCDAKGVQLESSKGTITGQMASVEVGDLFKAIFPPSTLADAFAVDSLCFGHTMELVPSGQSVRWLNPVSGVGVYLSPGSKSDVCRSYLGVTVVNGEKKKFRGEVCSPRKGVWQIQQ